MKIALFSDIHLEIADWHFESIDDADVVILAGDIAKGSEGITWAKRAMADRFPDKTFIYVAGNHEYYDAQLSLLSRFQKSKFQKLTEFNFLRIRYYCTATYAFWVARCGRISLCTATTLSNLAWPLPAGI